MIIFEKRMILADIQCFGRFWAGMLFSLPVMTFAGDATVRVVDRPDVIESSTCYTCNRAPLLPGRFIALPPGSVRPGGWLLKQLRLQADGFHGHLDEISQFLRKKDNAWLDPKGHGSHGWEELPYWLKGYANLAFTLGDTNMIATTTVWIEGVMGSQQADGWFGPDGSRENAESKLDGRDDLWPAMIMLFCLRDYCEFTGDPRVPAMMTRYFRYLYEKVPPDRLLNGYWPVMRGGDMLCSIYWLYNRTGDAWLLDLAKNVHAGTARWDKDLIDCHNVNIAQGFREPAVYHLQSRNSADLDAAYRNFRKVRELYGQVPGGMFGADERVRPGHTGPQQGIETCGIVEQMLSDELLLQVTGDPFWADNCEDVAFNTFPAALMPDMKNLRYLTAPNQPLSDAVNKQPGVETAGTLFLMTANQHRCCQHNWGHGWPYFTRHLWMAAPGNGLAAVMYAPSTVTAKVGDGRTVSITETTRYPFEETVTFAVKTEQPVRFPLHLRIPGWCPRAGIALNGKPIDVQASAGKFVVIERAWANGDTLELTFPMDMQVKVWKQNHGCVSVERGPLTYSLKIGEKRVRQGGSDKWPDWELHPATPWNYGLDLGTTSPTGALKVIRKEWPDNDMPFTHEGTPVMIEARGRRIPGWHLNGLGMVGEMQDSPIRSDEPVEPVTLVPMGAARLRISAFPVIGSGQDAKPWALTESEEARAARIKWWSEARFGMFIHWGVYSVPAGSYGGKAVQGTGEWIMLNGKIPVAGYKAFARQFNPVKYDPDAWVRLAKAAGMGYIVITAKHHDGFALFDSAVTDWDVVDATPYGKDLLLPLAESCRRHGLKIGFYYSQAQDWCHPGGAGGGWDEAQKGDMDQYLERIAVPQLHELMTGYGQLNILWWDTPYNMNRERAERVWSVLRNHPYLITNNRLGEWCEGDFETPEQGIPSRPLEHNWETCMTINETWGYRADDQDWKSARDLIRNLVEIASKGGNYLLNVGPDALGEIPAPCVERLTEIGRWMDVNGEAIRGTGPSPFGDLPFGRSTVKTAESTLYLYVFDWPTNGWIEVPGMRSPARSAVLLSAPRVSLLTEVPVPGVLRIKVPKDAPSPHASVIKLCYEGALQADRYMPKVRPSGDGVIELTGRQARTTGPLLYVGGTDCLQYWTGKDSAEWVVSTDASASYSVELLLSSDSGQHGTPFRVRAGAVAVLEGSVPDTGSRTNFQTVVLGNITLPKGESQVRIEPLRNPGGTAMNLRRIRLIPRDSADLSAKSLPNNGILKK